MKFQQGLRLTLLVTVVVLLVVYSALRERIPDGYNGIIAVVAIALLILNFLLIKRKNH